MNVNGLYVYVYLSHETKAMKPMACVITVYTSSDNWISDQETSKKSLNTSTRDPQISIMDQ